MKLAVTGATGYIGRRLVRTAAERGHHVVALVRTPCADIEPYSVQLPIDDSVKALERADAVIHLAGLAHVHRDERGIRSAFEEVNCHLPLRIAETARRAGVPRFVHVSSIGVHGGWSERPIDESSPFAARTPYAISKLEAELSLDAYFESQQAELVIVRPPMVYGPGCPGNFRRLVDLVRHGLPLPFGAVTVRRSFVYVSNLVDFLLHCATRPALRGTYVVGDGSDFNVTELLKGIAAGADMKVLLFPFPPRLLRAAARLIGLGQEMESLTRPMLVNWSRARESASWTPPFEVAGRIEESAAARRQPADMRVRT